MQLNPGEIHVWRYMLDETDYEAEKTSPLLSKEEQERCSDYLHMAEKVRYTCNHRFVKLILAKYLGLSPQQVSFSRAAMGKPFIQNSDLFFNYSYRTTFGLLALSKQEVGIDIEKIKILQDPASFSSFSFSEKEKELIFKNTGEQFQETLFTFWTFKEAIIKALGVGLNADLTRIDLSSFLYSEVNPLAFANNTVYTIRPIGADKGYKAAIALQGELNHYREFNFKDLYTILN